MDVTSVLAGSHTTVASTKLLGLITAVALCPMATNIAAVAYISHKVSNRKYIIMASTGLLAQLHASTKLNLMIV